MRDKERFQRSAALHLASLVLVLAGLLLSDAALLALAWLGEVLAWYEKP